jgi:hypothetical protein
MMENGQIYKLIPKVMQDIGAIGKDRENKQQGYKFRGIEDMYNAAHPALVKHGVFCAPEVLEHESQDRITTNRMGETKSTIRVWLKVKHTFFAPDGSSVSVTTCGEGIDASDKASNKALSGAMKYAMIELFSIPTEDVEDSDRDSPDAGIKPTGKPPDVTTEDIPLERILPPKEDLIDDKQKAKLFDRFRQELRPELRKDSDKFLNDWLGIQLFLDADGNPSANAIPKAVYAVIGKAAMEFARGL